MEKEPSHETHILDSKHSREKHFAGQCLRHEIIRQTFMDQLIPEASKVIQSIPQTRRHFRDLAHTTYKRYDHVNRIRKAQFASDKIPNAVLRGVALKHHSQERHDLKLEGDVSGKNDVTKPS